APIYGFMTTTHAHVEPSLNRYSLASGNTLCVANRILSFGEHTAFAHELKQVVNGGEESRDFEEAAAERYRRGSGVISLSSSTPSMLDLSMSLSPCWWSRSQHSRTNGSATVTGPRSPLRITRL